jgi:methyl-accepting chemotaxis protein
VSDTPSSQRIPPGLLGGGIFFVTVIVGCAFIVLSKTRDLSPVVVTSVPVLIMIGYAVLMATARLLRLRDDQAGDNLYYMGFLFTLTSLAVSLYQFSSTGSAEQIVRNFGIAIASTIAGIALRILFHQMRRDPVEVEATARLELADASRRVKRELDSTVIEFGYFRRMTQQSMADALDEMKGMLAEMRRTMGDELKLMSGEISRPLEETSRKSGDTVEALAERISAILDEVAERLVRETDHLSHGAGASAAAIETMVAKLEAMQTPEQIIEIKLAPMIQGFSRAVNAFSKGAETHERAVDKSLKRTHDVAAALVRLVDELRATQTLGTPNVDNQGPWGSVPGDKAAE